MHSAGDTNVVDVSVRRLRSKVDDPYAHKLLRTVRGWDMSWKVPNGASKAEKSSVWPSLAVQLTAWYTTASFLLVAAATLLLYLNLADNLRRISEQSLLDELNVCRALVLERARFACLHEEVEIDSAVRRYQKFYVRVLDGPAPIVHHTRNGSRPELQTPRRGGRGSHRRVLDRLARRCSLSRDHGHRAARSTGMTCGPCRQPSISPGRAHPGPPAPLDRMVLGAALIICPGVGFLIAHRGTRPLREVAETAAKSDPPP